MNDNSAGLDEKLADFYISELTDLTTKIENSDQRVQFFVQLYITIIAASVTLLAKELVYDRRYILCGFFWLALCIMGYYVFRYAIAGRSIHNEYINRSNHIRRTLLIHLRQKECAIEQYEYTSPKSNNPKGMSNWRIRFLQTCVASFGGAAVFFFLCHSAFTGIMNSFLISFVCLAVISALLEIVIQRANKELDDKAKKE